MSLTLHTSHGDLLIELFCDQCPITCKNFLALSASDYYNNTLFHRNIKSFIIQGGDPTNTGKGGESIYGSSFNDEINEIFKHNKRGIVSMANSGPNTNKSQFFITYGEYPQLDGKYTIFAQVVEGFDTLNKMEREGVNKKHKPLKDIILKNITIHFNPIAMKEIKYNVPIRSEIDLDSNTKTDKETNSEI